RRRNIVEHAVHEVGGLKQECFLEAFVESRRAFVAHAVRIGNVDAIEPGIVADRQPASRAEDLGERLVPVRHGARGIEAGHFAVGELAGRDTVVYVAELAQAMVDGYDAGRENADRFGIAEQPAGEVDVMYGAVEENAAAGWGEADKKSRRIVHVEV